MDGGFSRRRLLAVAGGSGAALAIGGTGYALGREADDEAISSESVPFYGEHQAGITTATQDRLHFAAFDLTTDRVSDVRALMQEWTAAAARMSQGQPVGPRNDVALAPPDDTGEATGLPPAKLTVTFGLGPGLFDRRFGLSGKRPSALAEIPRLPGDELDPAISGGDLAVQACADDPQVAFHAVRNLARIARGVAVMRWSQLGFGRTSSTSRAQDTPRNLMGFKDGTNNIHAEDADDVERFVWVDGEPKRMRNGTYMVTRRIRMLIEVWDRTTLDDQELTIGRRKVSGSPLNAKKEFDEVDLEVKDGKGELVTPDDAHIRLAGPKTNDGERILRRGYSFTDGFDDSLGQLDAGLFFICFQKDPHRQFLPMQRRLGSNDALNEYIKHVGSAVFACPPGVQKGGYVGEGLLG